VLEMNLQATRGLLPDRTILLTIDPGERRMGAERDRIEREDAGFVARVDDAYRELAELFPRRILQVDGSKPPDEVARTIRDELRDLS
jgi:dTMP kinase